MDFTNVEKEYLFDMISKNYFERNFGTMLKTDIDTLIFSVYIEHCIKNRKPFDDHTLSIELGITEARVRSLKERKQLRYPYENYNWKKQFIELIPKAKYNDTKRLVQLYVGDVDLIKDIRNYVYQHGWFDEFQLNPKLFQCGVDHFIDLCKSLEDPYAFDPETKRAIKSLAKNDKEKSAIEKIISGSFEDGMAELIKDVSKEALAEILKLLPFGGIAKDAIDAFINVIT